MLAPCEPALRVCLGFGGETGADLIVIQEQGVSRGSWIEKLQ